MVSTELASQATPSPVPAAPDSTRRRTRQHGRRRETGVRRVGVWFVGAKPNDPGLNWFQEQLRQAQAVDGRVRAELRLLFSPNPDTLPPQFREERLDGVILQGTEPGPLALARLRQVPTVWFMTRRSPAFPADYVEPNNEENGELAADYLASLGHRAVAVVTVNPEYSAIEQRTRAFLTRAQARGLKARAILGRATPGISYLQIAPHHAEHDQLVRRLLEQRDPPTGLYLPSDHFCGSFFRALREAGRAPGRDFDAVIGNYNPLIYHHLDHSPAVIDINLPSLVRQVIEHLLWRIDHLDTPGRVGITVSPRLVRPPEAASVAPGAVA